MINQKGKIMEQILIANIIAMNAIVNKIAETLESEVLTHSGSMQLEERPGESNEKYIERNNMYYRQFIQNAHNSLQKIQGYVDILETIARETKKKYEY